MKRKESKSSEKESDVKTRSVNDDLDDIIKPEPPLAPPKANSNNIPGSNKKK